MRDPVTAHPGARDKGPAEDRKAQISLDTEYLGDGRSRKKRAIAPTMSPATRSNRIYVKAWAGFPNISDVIQCWVLGWLARPPVLAHDFSYGVLRPSVS